LNKARSGFKTVIQPRLAGLRASRRAFLKAAVLVPAVKLALPALGAVVEAPPGRAVPWPAEVTAFLEAKERQARGLAGKLELEVAPEIWSYFAAARKADRETTSKLYGLFVPGRSAEGYKPLAGVRTPLFQTVLEVELVLECFCEGEPKYAAAFGRDIVASVPPGSVYFGGTDAGRGLPTAFAKSHARGEPFFILTQSTLTDNNYLAYLRAMYGQSLSVPAREDSLHCSEDYMKEARARWKHDQDFPKEPRQLKPDEEVRIVNGHFELSGPGVISGINGLLARLIFDQNPKREFYLEESAPVEWMYPRLAPHGLIMKIHRAPLASLTPEMLAQDRLFWLAQAKGLIGDWLQPDTTVQQVCAFAERVFVRKDLAGFRGDALFVKSARACRMYSRLRSTIGGVYAWRLRASAADDNSKSAQETERYGNEAEFAFKQAYAMCPSSPEALFRFVNLLLLADRVDEALLLAQTSLKVEPAVGRLKSLVAQLEQMKKAQQP
jgi:hypothetical protein